MRITSVGLIALFLILSAPIHAQNTIELKDIYNGTFSSKSVRGIRSMKNGQSYTIIERKDNQSFLSQYSYKTGKLERTLVKSAELQKMGFEDFQIEDYAFSPDESKVMLRHGIEPIYRRSTKASVMVVNIGEPKPSYLEDSKVMNPAFSPDGNKLAYVKENNLYVRDLNTGEEKAITSDGKPNSVIYGSADWVYEEEFAFSKAFVWSPDSKSIAFYRFDERRVREFDMTMYKGLYPEGYKFKYPKAGEANSFVEVYFWNEEMGVQPAMGANFEYTARLKWTKDPKVFAFIGMNRLQNQLAVVTYDMEQGPKIVLEETSKTYIEVDDYLTFLPNNKGFIWLSEKSGHNHIYKYDMDGKSEQAITSGEWDVTAYHGIDGKGNIYYTSAEKSPLTRQVYKIAQSGKGKQMLTPVDGVSRPNFSASMDYFINVRSTANSPNEYVLYDNDGKKVRELEMNKGLKSKIAGYTLNKKEFLTVKGADGTDLNAWMIKPPNFDKSKKHPVLMYVYGGPGSQTVEDNFSRNYYYHQALAAKGYIVVSVDNRGTGARGRDFRVGTYKQLGKLESADQIAAAKNLGKLAYVDEGRIGIWGWSYGGYMSSLCLFKGADVFKAAIAVAPVTNWRYYDSIYTERYMGLPKDNANGYDNNSPINHVDKMQGKLLLVHGTADDNVHFQNTVEMVDALIEADKDFEMMMYPDKNHGIYGGNTRKHLYRNMMNFVEDNL